MTLASGGVSDLPACGPPLASPSIWPAVQSFRWGLVHKSRGNNTYVGAVEEMLCVWVFVV